MNSKERFFGTITFEAVDRSCIWLGIPDTRAHARLFRHFRLGSMPELMRVLDDDIWPVELPCHSPVSDAIYMAFDFTGGNALQKNDERITKLVHRLREIFPTSLNLSPSHEAILPDTPPANVEALFRAARD